MRYSVSPITEHGKKEGGDIRDMQEVFDKAYRAEITGRMVAESP